MGFFDTIKDGAKMLSDRVTGGYGEMVFNIDRNEASRGEPVMAMVNIKATGEIMAKRIIVRLAGQETCTMEISWRDHRLSLRKKRETQNRNTNHVEMELTGSFEMQKGETRTFEGSIEVPRNSQPTYYGVQAQHRWYVSAEVEIPWGKNLTGNREIFIK